MSLGNSKHTNRLISEKSPYLLQHVHNPVNWYPWGEEAFEKARKEDKPVFLSVGYSTCHWCHVMERESFENEEIAEIINTYFIAVKVDREERPDVDAIYMDAVQIYTRGGGGWPMSVFMTPDKRPFFAGTYFPPESKFGRPGFKQLLGDLAAYWRDHRNEIEKAAANLTEYLGDAQEAGAKTEIGGGIFEQACQQFRGRFDPVHGGFGNAPKFPSAHNLSFLMAHWFHSGNRDALDIALTTLRHMAGGGLYDHLGGGFARYSVDREWLVPHFEKMLYDQATLCRAYVEAWQITGEAFFQDVARGVIEYVLRDMTDAKGGFYCAEDADSEGHEGLFYLWTREEIEKLLGTDAAALFGGYYGVTQFGNFEGRTILNIAPGRTLEKYAAEKNTTVEALRQSLAASRKILFDAREKRVHPHKDDKILTAWNGMMISAMAHAGAAFGEARYIAAAERAMQFVQSTLADKRGRLLRRYRDGEAALPGYLEDYAFVTQALLDLYEATFKDEYLEQAVHYNEETVRLFWDAEGKGFFFSGGDNEALLRRSKDFYDGAHPCGNSAAAVNLLRIASYTGKEEYSKKADELLFATSYSLTQGPVGHGRLLVAAMLLMEEKVEIVIAGGERDDSVQAMIKETQRRFIPNKIVVLHRQGEAGKQIEKTVPWVAPQAAVNGKAALYVCKNFACQTPVTDVKAALAKLQELAGE